MLCTGNKYLHFISIRVTFYFTLYIGIYDLVSLLPEKCMEMITETHLKFFYAYAVLRVCREMMIKPSSLKIQNNRIIKSGLYLVLYNKFYFVNQK